MEQEDDGEAATQETTQEKILVGLRAAQTLTRKLLAQQLGISEGGVDIKYDPGIHHRRSIRLRGYDYSRAGACFVTICTQHHECLFGDIVGGEMRLNDAGLMIQAVWDRLPIRFHHIELDEFTVMPNHVHGIMIFTRGGESCIRPDYRHQSNANLGDDQSGDHIKGDHKDRSYGDLPAADNYTDRLRMEHCRIRWDALSRPSNQSPPMNMQSA